MVVIAVNEACRIVVEILFGFAAGFCVDYGRSDRRRNPGKILVCGFVAVRFLCPCENSFGFAQMAFTRTRNLRRTKVSRGVAQGAMNRSNTDAERFCSGGGLFGIGKDWNE